MATDDLVPGDGLFPPAAYAREDDSADGGFYSFPRKVVHIDDGAIGALGRVYAETLPPLGRILDLMSSWRSHLPAPWPADAEGEEGVWGSSAAGPPCELVGLGMNAEEMADNPQLARFVVHDVNRDPRLPFGDAAFDAAICAVSIQYVVHPVRLFREVQRVLRPGAPFVVSFSNRCFPTKAVAVWLDTTDEQHLELVRAYFDAAGGWIDVRMEDRSPPGDANPLYVVMARRALTPAAAA